MPAEWFLNKLRLVARGAQPVACSDCFENTGVRYEAASIGKWSVSTCPRCGSVSGFKLDKGDVELLQEQFYSLATAPHKSNMRLVSLRIEQDTTDQVEKLRPETWRDWHVLQQLVGGDLGYTAPRLFYFGVTNHFDGPNGSLLKRTVSDVVLPRLRSRSLSEADEFYRIRLNIDSANRNLIVLHSVGGASVALITLTHLCFMGRLASKFASMNAESRSETIFTSRPCSLPERST